MRSRGRPADLLHLTVLLIMYERATRLLVHFVQRVAELQEATPPDSPSDEGGLTPAKTSRASHASAARRS